MSSSLTRAVAYKMASDFAKTGNHSRSLDHLEKSKEDKVDLIKLMITGGVMDAKKKGVPGELKMSPEMVRAVCEKAHA